MLRTFMQELRCRGSQLWVNEGALRFKVYKDSPLTQSDLSFLKANKPEIIEWLLANPDFFQARPLSENQRAMWLLYQMDETSNAYNLSHAVSLPAELNVGYLQQAFGDLLHEHEILRTGYFNDEQGEPLQKVRELAKDPSLSFRVESAKSFSEQAIKQWTEAEADKAFDLGKGEVCRGALLQNHIEPAGKIQNIFQLSVHHIAADFWSCEVIFDELLTRYCVLAGIEEPLSAEPSAPQQNYFDWAQQQYCEQQGDRAVAAEQFWRRSLDENVTSTDTISTSTPSRQTPEGLLSPPELFTDFSRPEVQSYRGEVIQFPFSDDLNTGLRQQAKKLGVTPFVFCLSAFQVLLSRYSGQNKFVIGMPTSGRQERDVQRTIGYLVNPVPVPCDCAILESSSESSASLMFSDLVQRVKQQSQAIFQHQGFPFSRLIETLGIPGDTSRNPIFQHLFALTHVHQQQHNHLIEHTWLSEQRGAAVDLSLVVLDSRNGFTGEWRYNQDLFSADTAQTMISAWLEILACAANAPQTAIHEFPLMPLPQQRLMLSDWNSTNTDIPRQSTIPELFEQQVERTPDAIAIDFHGTCLSYRQLNHRANQLAAYLREHYKIQPDDLIGLCVERSADMVVGILAILKAGGAYVPLDPDYPTTRLNHMLSDAQPKLVLVQPPFFDLIPLSADKKVLLDSDENPSQFASYCSDNRRNDRLTSSHLAYVLYTSGSTGTPKGVMVEHGNVIRLVKNSNYLDFSQPQVFAQASNMCFDAATFEIWGSLLNDGKLVGISKSQLMNFARLEETLDQVGVTVMFLTVILFNAISREYPTTLSKLDTVMFGGEDCSIDTVRHLAKHGKPKRLIHIYGPTESTTFAVWKLLDEAQLHDVNKLALGKPLSNTQVYVLDPQRQPVPVGMPGELYLGGEGVARGYLNQPEMTREKFIPMPENLKPTGAEASDSDASGSNASDTDAYLYKTGDIVRWLPDGELMFIGRCDEQVKVRGFRIETGEIESALCQFEQVSQAVIRVLDKGEAGKALAAYVVLSAPTPENPKEALNSIRQQLAAVLPGYMQPQAWAVIDSVPITHNGKTDHKALPEPDMQILEDEYIAPSTETQKTLCEICQSLLEIERVGINSNFFDLGGNSLVAAKLIAQIKERFQVELALNQFFTVSSISQLAELIDTHAPAVTASDVDRMNSLLDELGV